MFSRSKQEDSLSPLPVRGSRATPRPSCSIPSRPPRGGGARPGGRPRPSRPPSVLSSDLTIIGNVKSSGDIQVEGTVEGDVRAQMLIVGEAPPSRAR